ncbi:hypothetical protein TNCV_3456051 [Trichonephila clavipes]|nr:hypothetical protein TNCV_3456051 [Trichonephila clavipes]
MCGSTCADMQVDVMRGVSGSIKHVVGVRSQYFWQEIARRIAGRIIGKLEEGRSVTSVAAEFAIAHSIVSRHWRQFQTTGTAIRGSVVVVHEEPHPQMTDTLSYRPEETGGRQWEKSLTHDTGHWTTDIAFYRGQKTARWWSVCTTPCTVCTFNALPIGEGVIFVVPGTPELRDNEWGRVLFTDESRFSLSSDSHRILIWRGREARNHPRTSLKGTGMEVTQCSRLGGIMLGRRTDLHIFDAGSVNGTRYCNEILLPYVRLLEALWVCNSFHRRQCTMS